MRSALSALSVAGLMMVSGCRSDTSIESQPTDSSSGRDLAKAVAGKAECGSFEDSFLLASGRLTFSCQINGQTFLIQVFTSEKEKEARDQELSDADIPHKVGKSFLVWEAKGAVAGTESTPEPGLAEDLAAFPGTACPSNKRTSYAGTIKFAIGA